MSNRPRTLDHFPRMKPRGDRRRLRNHPSFLIWWWQQNAPDISASYDAAITRHLTHTHTPALAVGGHSSHDSGVNDA